MERDLLTHRAASDTAVDNSRQCWENSDGAKEERISKSGEERTSPEYSSNK